MCRVYSTPDAELCISPHWISWDFCLPSPQVSQDPSGLEFCHSACQLLPQIQCYPEICWGSFLSLFRVLMMKFSAADPSTDPWAVAVIASWGLCNDTTFTSSFVKFVTAPKCAWQFPGINNNQKIRDPNRWNVHWFSNFCSFLSHLPLIACEGNVTAWGLHKLLPAGKVSLRNSWFCAFWDLALIGSLPLVRKWTSVCFVPHLSKLQGHKRYCQMNCLNPWCFLFLLKPFPGNCWKLAPV